MSCDFRKASRTHWDIQGKTPLNADIQLGALLRIADALEVVAQNYEKLIKDCEMLQSRLKEERACSNRLARSNTALRGAFKRLKKNKNKGAKR